MLSFFVHHCRRQYAPEYNPYLVPIHSREQTCAHLKDKTGTSPCRNISNFGIFRHAVPICFLESACTPLGPKTKSRYCTLGKQHDTYTTRVENQDHFIVFPCALDGRGFSDGFSAARTAAGKRPGDQCYEACEIDRTRKHTILVYII